MHPTTGCSGKLPNQRGADDDGSGVVAVLELARLFANQQTIRPIWFVLFTGEEEGLLGSTAFAQHLAQTNQNVHLMLSLDPIGYNPAGAFFLWYSFNSQWPEAAETLDQLALDRKGPLQVTGVDEALIGGDARSDHYPFWQNGYSALHIANFPLSPNYHTLHDQIGDVDSEYLASTTILVADLVFAMADKKEPKASCSSTSIRFSVWLFLFGAATVSYRRYWNT